MTNPRVFYEAVYAEIFYYLNLLNEEPKLGPVGGAGIIVSTVSLLYVPMMFYFGDGTMTHHAVIL